MDRDSAYLMKICCVSVCKCVYVSVSIVKQKISRLSLYLFNEVNIASNHFVFELFRKYIYILLNA